MTTVEENYHAQSGEPTDSKIQKLTVYFDSNGRMTKLVRYDQDGEPTDSTTTVYDAKGAKVQVIHYDSDDVILSMWKKTPVYDTEGKLKEYYAYNSDGTLDEKTEYVYDRQQQTMTEIHVTPDGERTWSSSTRYDSQGNLSEKTDYYSDNTPKCHTLYTPTGEISSLIRYDEDATPVEEQEFFYDSQARLIEWKRYRGHHTLDQHHLIHYDNTGKKVKSIVLIYNTKGNFQYQEITRYDAWENEILRTIVAFNDVIIRQHETSYDYDVQHNWIKKVEIQKSRPLDVLVMTTQIVTSRTIVYEE
jgi:YD repeat-containing protein